MKSDLIERILNSGFRAVLVTTGGGSGALNALLTTPGASRFVTEAHVPYSPEALERFLGEKTESSCSPETAVKLAQASFKFPVSNFKFLAVSCTAALQTDRERRGDDRAFICIKTEASEKLYALYFSKTSRAEQEALLSNWLLILIAQAVGAERGLMLSGSFNPVHQGHCNLLKVAEEMTGLRGVFELSCANVDKPDIPEEEILRRASAIWDIPVALTHAPRFIQKAELFPKTTFVLGYDTAARLIDPAYSKDWKNQWESFQCLETKFLVAGRHHGGGFQTLENLKLPNGFEALFEAVPESKFREDISSTQLRMS
jgi:nicotinamide mononucleotide (NMN) deamidase PncC